MSDPLAILVAVLALAAVGYVLWRPQMAVVAILVLYPMEQLLQTYFPPLRGVPWAINVGVGLLAGFAILTRVAKGERPLASALNPVWICSILLFMYAGVAVIWTPNPMAHRIMITSLPYFLLFVVAVPLLLEDVAEFRSLTVSVLLVGTLIVGLILINPQTTFTSGRLGLDYGFGKTSNPLALATLGGLISLMAALIRFEQKSVLLHGLRIVAFIIGLGLAISSGSRGQVLAAIAVVILFYPLARELENPKQFLLTAFGLLLLVGGLFLVFDLFVSDVNRGRWASSGMQSAVEGRAQMISDLFGAWASQPSRWLIGLGTNAFRMLSPTGIPYVHNLLAEILCELGIIGATMLGILLTSCTRSGLWLWRRFRYDPRLRSVAALLCAMAVYSFALALKQGSFAVGGGSAFLWFIILASIAKRERQLAADEEEAWAAEGYAEHLDDEHADAGHAHDDSGDYGDYDEEYALT